MMPDARTGLLLVFFFPVLIAGLVCAIQCWASYERFPNKAHPHHSLIKWICILLCSPAIAIISYMAVMILFVMLIEPFIV